MQRMFSVLILPPDHESSVRIWPSGQTTKMLQNEKKKSNKAFSQSTMFLPVNGPAESEISYWHRFVIF